MKNWKISFRLFAAFGVMCILAMLIGGFGTYGMILVNTSSINAYNDNVVAIDGLANIRTNFEQQRVALRELLLEDPSSKNFSTIEKELSALQATMPSMVASYEATITSEEERDIFQNFKDAYGNTYVPLIASVKNAAIENNVQKGKLLIAQTTDQVKKMEAALIVCNNTNMKDSSLALDENEQQLQLLSLGQIGLLLFTILGAAVCVTLLNRHIVHPIRQMVSAANNVAEGNMDFDLQIDTTDEMGQLAVAFKDMAENIASQTAALKCLSEGDLTINVTKRSDKDAIGTALQDLSNSLNTIIHEVSTVSAQVATGASQVADGSQSLAQGASEQAAAIEELSSSIHEISLSTRESTQKATTAAELYATITKRAQDSRVLMDEMLKAVEEITQASENISSIIKLINDISFQTNILSLNAAVEAANAGQHGRGFAVVASEVRSLAGKSSEAARSTDVLIENSIAKANLGSQIANKTYKALTNIISDIEQSSELISFIAKSANEQSIGIDQVNIGIDQVAQVVNMNSSTAEQSAMAAEEMASQAEAMERLVATFKLRDTVQKSTPSPRQSTPHKPYEDTPVIVLDDTYVEKY